MNENDTRIDANFFQLIISLQMAAMQNMGKIASPLSGKVERSLEQASISIDMLSMLAAKTKGNLTGEEQNLLDRVLYELRMNYVDEIKKDESAPKECEEDKKEDKG